MLKLERNVGKAKGTRVNIILKWLSTNGKEMMSNIISVSPNEQSLPEDLDLIEDIAYEGPDGASLAADVYRPKNRTADPLPIAVFVHGGGLFVGSRKANREFAGLLARRGYVVFALSYRLIDEADGPHEIGDVCAGLTYLTTHAAEYGGDLSRVLLIGESAGGFLGLYATAACGSPYLRETLGIEAPDLRIRGLACFGGMFYTARFDPIGITYRRDLYGEHVKDEAFMELINPEDSRVETSLPPVFMVASKDDFLKGYTQRLNDAYTRAGHDHRLVYFPHGKELTHAFPSLQPGLPQSKVVLEELDGWFRKL